MKFCMRLIRLLSSNDQIKGDGEKKQSVKKVLKIFVVQTLYSRDIMKVFLQFEKSRNLISNYVGSF